MVEQPGAGIAGGMITGITATLPVEVIFAAGARPVDLNNLFINSESPGRMVDFAENSGLPATVCNWIKGMYAAVVQNSIPFTACVTGGDCTNAIALMEILQHEGRKTTSFSYPYSRDKGELQKEIISFAGKMETTLSEAEKVFDKLRAIRKNLSKLDEMTWRDGVVTGQENHQWLVSSSDFNGDYRAFGKKLEAFLEKASKRKPITKAKRLGYIGVPPIISNLYEFAASKGAEIVFNETQRAFSLPFDADTMVAAYLEYTYPYSVFHRLEDIKKEIRKREIRGVIHYVQNACHRQLLDVIFQKELEVPVLMLDADRPAKISAAQMNRLEAFIETI